MAVARVIPLRRLPRQRPWFDYAIPTDLDVRAGQIVSVPFLQRQILGVVWDVVADSSVPNLRPIKSISIDHPVISDWQRLLFPALQAQALGDLGSVVQSALPTFTKKTVWPEHQPTSQNNLQTTETHPVGPTWWYTRRSQAILWIQAWLAESPTPRVIITPTIEDCQRIAAEAQKIGVTVSVVHSQLTPATYRRLYLDVARGRVQHVVGTWAGLLLPYPTTPTILIDQEEHPAHRPQAFPKWDMALALTSLSLEFTVTTPAPSIQWFVSHQPSAPQRETLRTIASLDRPTKIPWLTVEAEDLLAEAKEKSQQVAIIVPRHGYASTVACQACGQALECPVCHHRASLAGRPPEPLLCTFCGQQTALPATCPRCHHADWRYGGIGPERLVDILAHHNISASTQAKAGTAVIGTYQIYKQLSLENISGLILLHGDALLNWPDFSAEERAWQYLARMEAEVERPVLVQTYSPENTFWQRWQHATDEVWYQQEVLLRQRLRLPPTVDQWLAEAAGVQDKDVQHIQEKLQTQFGPGLLVTQLPIRRQGLRRISRLLLTTNLGRMATLTDWSTWWPAPWHIDTAVRSWID